MKIEIPGISNLSTTVALTSAEKKRKKPNVSDLIRKADYDPKISEMEKKNYYF